MRIMRCRFEQLVPITEMKADLLQSCISKTGSRGQQLSR